MSATLLQHETDATAELFRNEGIVAVQVVGAIADAIRELGSVPSGHLYARLMGHVSLATYQTIISNIANTGLIRVDGNHLLVWTGPNGPASEQQPNQQQTQTNAVMKITVPFMSTLATIKATHNVPSGTTHFRFTSPGKKPIIDAMKNIDTLSGCTGKLEFGKAEFNGRGRHAKIVGFNVLAVATAPVIPGTNKPKETAPDLAPAQDASTEVPSAGATTPKAAKPTRADAQPTSKGRKSLIFGCSACAVAKSLGKAGVKWSEADAIFRTNGIDMPKASLSVQLGFGRNEATWERHGKPAPLSDAQIAELRSGATVAA